jgi:hypothetical protein
MRNTREAVNLAIQNKLLQIEEAEDVTVLDSLVVDILTGVNGSTIEQSPATNPRGTEFVSR